MILRANHVAGGIFIALGIFVFAVSGDLPFGTISAPGAGMMPKLIASLMIVFAVGIIMMDTAGETLSSVKWDDATHATLLVVITGVAISLYTTLGFILTMSLLIFTLLVAVERRNILRAAAYSIALTLFAYFLFGTALKAPLERGIFWL